MDLESFESMLEQGRDNALLRFTLGQGYLNGGDAQRAAVHLAEAVKQDPDYSAAWKLYGRALDAAGRPEEAAKAFREGIRVSEAKGDKQAAKEMQVFLKRLEKKTPGGET